MSGSLRWSCLSRHRPVFDPQNRVFILSLFTLTSEGRKGVRERLRRHPLIDSIFSTSLQPFPDRRRRRRRRAISIPFAWENLHLVIPLMVEQAMHFRHTCAPHCVCCSTGAETRDPAARSPLFGCEIPRTGGDCTLAKRQRQVQKG